MILIFGMRGRETKFIPSAVQETSTSSSTTSSLGNVKLDSRSIAQHNTAEDCWIIVSDKVYAVSSFLYIHPGGVDQITPYCGKDATTAFDNRGGNGQHSFSAYQMLADYFIGNVNSSVPQKKIQTIQNNQPTGVPGRQGRELEDD
jgi:cytochrome b involved in lipid metabolism